MRSNERWHELLRKLKRCSLFTSTHNHSSLDLAIPKQFGIKETLKALVKKWCVCLAVVFGADPARDRDDRNYQKVLTRAESKWTCAWKFPILKWDSHGPYQHKNTLVEVCFNMSQPYKPKRSAPMTMSTQTILFCMLSDQIKPNQQNKPPIQAYCNTDCLPGQYHWQELSPVSVHMRCLLSLAHDCMSSVAAKK